MAAKTGIIFGARISRRTHLRRSAEDWRTLIDTRLYVGSRSLAAKVHVVFPPAILPLSHQTAEPARYLSSPSRSQFPRLAPTS